MPRSTEIKCSSSVTKGTSNQNTDPPSRGSEGGVALFRALPSRSVPWPLEPLAQLNPQLPRKSCAHTFTTNRPKPLPWRLEKDLTPCPPGTGGLAAVPKGANGCADDDDDDKPCAPNAPNAPPPLEMSASDTNASAKSCRCMPGGTPGPLSCTSTRSHLQGAKVCAGEEAAGEEAAPPKSSGDAAIVSLPGAGIAPTCDKKDCTGSAAPETTHARMRMRPRCACADRFPLSPPVAAFADFPFAAAFAVVVVSGCVSGCGEAAVAAVTTVRGLAKSS
mmetsp:Transcript_73317/g.138398  ORF Transcript_73317/g.138398 Transcript_73317/m.138398 type:complete len:276 (+) Transcript_73317:762-1589(+)